MFMDEDDHLMPCLPDLDDRRLRSRILGCHVYGYTAYYTIDIRYIYGGKGLKS
jgi:hypothetical protein